MFSDPTVLLMYFGIPVLLAAAQFSLHSFPTLRS